MSKTELPTQSPPSNTTARNQSAVKGDALPQHPSPDTPDVAVETQEVVRSDKTDASVQLPSNKDIPVEVVPPAPSETQTKEVQLRTPYGDITVSVDKPLPKDYPITVKVNPAAPDQITATIYKQKSVEAIAGQPAVQVVQIEDLPVLKEGQIIHAYYIANNATEELSKELQIIAPKAVENPNIPVKIKEKIVQQFAQLSEPEAQEFALQLTSKIVHELATHPETNITAKTSPESVVNQIPRTDIKTTTSVISESVKTETEKNLLTLFQAQFQTRLTQSIISPNSETITSTSLTPQKNVVLSESLIQNLLTTETVPSQPNITQTLFVQLNTTLNNPLQEQQFKVISTIPSDIPKASVVETFQNLQAKAPISTSQTPQNQNIETTQHPTLTNNSLQLTTVTGHSPNGSPLLETAEGQKILIATPTNIPVGSHLIIQAVTDPQAVDSLNLQGTGISPNLTPTDGSSFAPKTSEITFPPIPMFAPLQSQTWPALEQAVDTLLQTAPITAQALKNTIPTPSPRLVPTALFFLVALKMGNIESWLGEKNINALQNAGRRDIIDRLSSDFTNISRQSNEAIAGDWRSISLPMMHDDQISAFQLLLKDQHSENSDDESSNKEKQTRFLLNFRLSNMGPLQLDGLLTGQNLDVIIRATDTLPVDIKQDIHEKFQAGIKEVNLKGSVSFQENNIGWVDVTANTSNNASVVV